MGRERGVGTRDRAREREARLGAEVGGSPSRASTRDISPFFIFIVYYPHCSAIECNLTANPGRKRSVRAAPEFVLLQHKPHILLAYNTQQLQRRELGWCA